MVYILRPVIGMLCEYFPAVTNHSLLLTQTGFVIAAQQAGNVPSPVLIGPRFTAD